MEADVFIPGFPGKKDGCFRHGGFLQPVFPGYLLDGVPVAVPCGEIHFAVDASGVVPQYSLDRAYSLEE